MAQARTLRVKWLALAGVWLAGAALAGPVGAPVSWSELSPQQREILAPLGNEWNTLDKTRRQKWLGIADRYATMTPLEQQRLQKRMREWAALTPEQRKAARDRYKDLRKTPQAEKEALAQKWEEYRNLPDEEKRKLAASKAARPNAKSVPGPTSGTRVAPVKKSLLPPTPATSSTHTAAPALARSVSDTSPTVSAPSLPHP